MNRVKIFFLVVFILGMAAPSVMAGDLPVGPGYPNYEVRDDGCAIVGTNDINQIKNFIQYIASHDHVCFGTPQYYGKKKTIYWDTQGQQTGIALSQQLVIDNQTPDRLIIKGSKKFSRNATGGSVTPCFFYG